MEQPDDMVAVDAHYAPRAPAHGPATELKRSCSAQELRERLSRHSLAVRGTKSDLSLRLARRESGPVTPDEVSNEFSVRQLQRRLASHGDGGKGRKHELAARLSARINGLGEPPTPDHSC